MSVGGLAPDGLSPSIRVQGAGPVALSCALMMVREGLPAPLISVDRPTMQRAPQGGPARRVLALSEGSRQILSRIVNLPAAGVIREIEVTMHSRAGRSRIRASDHGVEALGHVIEWHDVVDALSARAASMDFATGTDTSASLIVHAEGMPAASDAREREFGQTALLAEVDASHPGTHDTAYEHFGPHGPLAFLPLARQGRYSMVWCDADAQSRRRASAHAQSLHRELAAAFDSRLGRLEIVSPIVAAPLTRRTRQLRHRGHELWIGNAAQALHPVAGQGLNLGLRDAFELARMIGDEHAGRRDIGQHGIGQHGFGQHRSPLDGVALAAAYVRRRSVDRGITIRLTDLLASVFSHGWLHASQSLALDLLELVPGVQRPLSNTLLFGRRA